MLAAMKALLSWSLLLISIVGLVVTFPMWLRHKIDTRFTVGLTLVLSWLALSYAPVTALFVSRPTTRCLPGPS
jgi:flagellar biosynthesis protein FliR